MKNVLVNAQPMTVVGTGIGRYLRGLSRACEEHLAGEVRLSYFFGGRVADAPPDERGAGWRERMGQLLWKLPWPVAYGARRASHALAEAQFARACTGFDAYHEAGYFPLAVREPVRTVLTVHDLSLLRFPHWHPRERAHHFRRHFPDRLAWVDEFCAVSEFTRREMVEHLCLDPERIRVAPPGYDPALFNTGDDANAQRFLDQAGVPGRFILFVGSGDPRKNLASVPAALEAAGCDAPLVTVGWSGWHQGGERGTFDLGYVSDRVLAQLYRRARLLVMPSAYEGFGLPVLEAMACGCPVVTSRAKALLEVGGEAVVSIEDVNDPKQFGQILTEVLRDRDRRGEMAAAGLGRAAGYAWSATCAQTAAAWFAGHP